MRHRLFRLWVFTALLSGPASLFAAPAADRDPIAKTTLGEVRGYLDQGIRAFKGIPYGADTARHRFQPPLPPAAWKRPRDALHFAPHCPQAAGGSATDVSEDCLTLNVWTPALRDRSKRPVLVYFHGGAYNNGSVTEDLYDGVRLSRRGDVVVVTVNHRLNGFGYLYLAEIGGPQYRNSGNAGMLDLVLALHWVHDNIAEFGGDRKNVTIFGQSGGGAKCATLMAMPAARGLFQRVWTMSGQQVTGRTREHATQTARAVLSALQLTPERIDELQTISTERLVEAMRGASWTPVVDGAVLPRDPFSPDATPLSKDIPMVLGNMRDETTSLIGPGDPDVFNLTWDALPAKIVQHVKPFIGELAPQTIIDNYRQWYPDYSPTDIFFSATTAARSWKGMLIESERRAAQDTNTFVYYVHWRSPADGGKWKSPHTLDIPLVFDNIAQSPYTSVAAVDAQKVAGAMADALLAFARSGDPNARALPRWPRFDLQRRASMIFDLTPQVIDDPRGDERKLFAPITYVQPGT
jgi:para-nitrobenzyl esterase